MSTWRRLQVQLRAWLDQESGPLFSFPDPRNDDQTPPFHIGLWAWATDAAEALHTQFGAEVVLTVGLLSYPGRELPEYRKRGAAWRPTPTPESGLRVEEVSPLTVASGHTVNVPVWVINTSSARQVLETNGSLQSRVLDTSGTPVGCADGAQTAPGVSFPIEPGERVQVPVVIGTASFEPALGYAIPPGSWTVEIHLPTAGQLAFAHLPLTITE